MGLFSEFDKVLVSFLVIVLIVIFVSAGTLPLGRPTHQLSSIGVDTNTIADNNVILARYGGTGVSSCLDGNVLKWSSSQNKWVCGDVNATNVIVYNSTTNNYTTLQQNVTNLQQNITNLQQTVYDINQTIVSGGGLGFDINFISPVTIASGLNSKAATVLDLSPYVPLGSSAVILAGWARSDGSPASPTTIFIQKDSTSPQYRLVDMTGTAASGNVAITAAYNGIFPVTSDSRIVYSVNPGNAYAGWSIQLIGYIKSTSGSGSVSSLPTCSEGKILKYQSGNWVCANDLTSGTVSLTNCHFVDASFGAICPVGEVLTAMDRSNCSTVNPPGSANCWAKCCSITIS